jgi:hypothetical protein
MVTFENPEVEMGVVILLKLDSVDTHVPSAGIYDAQLIPLEMAD